MVTTIIIKVTKCGECPYVQCITGGLKHACGHPTNLVKYPYANTRRVESDKIAIEICPLLEEAP